MSEMLDMLLEHKIVAIVRGIETQHAEGAGKALIDGGIRLMEITMNTQGATEMIHHWRSVFDGQAAIGAGTVTHLDLAKSAVAAGAQFLISPNLDEEVLAYGLERGISVWPGVMTPTEIVKAWRAGAEAVKLFPMGTLGAEYLKEIRGPLNDIPILATGGADLNNMVEYFEAGANALGMGSKLLNLNWVREGRLDLVTERARKFTDLASSL